MSEQPTSPEGAKEVATWILETLGHLLFAGGALLLAHVLQSPE